MKKTYCACFIALSCVGSAGADTANGSPLTIGIGGAWVHSPYQGDKNRGYALPYFNYQYGEFFIDGDKAGYRIWYDQNDTLDIIVTSSENEYRPSKNHIDSMRSLKKRHITMMMGGQWRHHATWGILQTSVTGDVLNQSNGFVWDSQYHYLLPISNSLSLTPGIGLSWLSGHQANYYYGVSSVESERSGISHYESSNSWQPYAELAVYWTINNHWSLSAGARYTRFSSDIKNSPMLDKSGASSFWSGLAYRF